MMPKYLLFAMLIESALIALTTTLLVQPALVFREQSERLRSAARSGGFVLLCVTFCWSFIFGCMLALNSISVRI